MMFSSTFNACRFLTRSKGYMTGFSQDQLDDAFGGTAMDRVGNDRGWRPTTNNCRKFVQVMVELLDRIGTNWGFSATTKQSLSKKSITTLSSIAPMTK